MPMPNLLQSKQISLDWRTLTWEREREKKSRPDEQMPEGHNSGNVVIITA